MGVESRRGLGVAERPLDGHDCGRLLLLKSCAMVNVRVARGLQAPVTVGRPGCVTPLEQVDGAVDACLAVPKRLSVTERGGVPFQRLILPTARS